MEPIQFGFLPESSWLHEFVLIVIVLQGLGLIGVIANVRTRDVRGGFLAGFNAMLPATLIQFWYSDADPARMALIGAFVLIYLVRMNITLTMWYPATSASKLMRTMPPLTHLIMPMVLVNTFGLIYILPFNWALERTGPFDWIEYTAIAVYSLGTVLHFGSDFQKYLFKRQPGTKGKILDTGFWSICRHPNYFGDALIFTSFAILAAHPVGFVSPLVCVMQYLGDAIPKTEKMAAERYGRKWQEYKSRTYCFIPYVY